MLFVLGGSFAAPHANTRRVHIVFIVQRDRCICSVTDMTSLFRHVGYRIGGGLDHAPPLYPLPTGKPKDLIGVESLC